MYNAHTYFPPKKFGQKSVPYTWQNIVVCSLLIVVKASFPEPGTMVTPSDLKNLYVLMDMHM